jgi:hypothetical protein
VSLDDVGDTFITGAQGDASGGAAFVFVRAGAIWTQQARLVGTGGIGSRFGIPVRLSADGSLAFIGSTSENSNAGTAYVFSRAGSTWTQRGPRLVPPQGATYHFGFDLAFAADGRTALVGSGSPVDDVASPVRGVVFSFDLCPPIECTADFNWSGYVSILDIFDFLTAWLNADPRADFNGIDGITTQDILDFIADWFAGC